LPIFVVNIPVCTRRIIFKMYARARTPQEKDGKGHMRPAKMLFFKALDQQKRVYQPNFSFYAQGESLKKDTGKYITTLLSKGIYLRKGYISNTYSVT
jgi:hypothetical protein